MQTLYYKTFNYLEAFNPSHLGIYFSLILHLFILLFALGLPDFFKPKKIYIPHVIPIEILNISNVTSLSPKKNEPKINNKQNKSFKQKKFNSSENNELQTAQPQEKPKLKSNIQTHNTEVPREKNIKNQNILNNNQILQQSDSKKISLKEKNIKKITDEKIVKEKIIKKDNVESLKIEKIKPKLKPKLIENTDPKTDIQIDNSSKLLTTSDNKKPEPDNSSKSLTTADNKKQDLVKLKPLQKPEPDLTMATIMKDLRNEEVNNLQEEETEEKDDKISTADQKELVDNSELQITLANLAMQQLQGCVSIDSGQLKGNYSSQYIITKAKYNIDGKVIENSIQIVDINISNRIKKMIESRVIFALNTCSLSLPEEHYELWKSITMTFDVDQMLNK